MLLQSLALVGFPCSGKSTVGQLLAAHYHCHWIDSDLAIERSTGHSPAQWIQSQGQEAFRKIEQNWLQNWQPQESCILSTGGGLPCYQDNLRMLSGKAKIVYLYADFETLYIRLTAAPAHILTTLYDQRALCDLHQQRHQIYQHADFCVSSAQSPEKTCEEVIQKLSQTAYP